MLKIEGCVSQGWRDFPKAEFNRLFYCNLFPQGSPCDPHQPCSQFTHCACYMSKKQERKEKLHRLQKIMNNDAT